MRSLRPRAGTLVLASYLFVHCGSDETKPGPPTPEGGDGASGGASNSGGTAAKGSGGTAAAAGGALSAGGNGGGGAPGAGGARVDGGGPPSRCEPFGHFSEPVNTFTLPSGRATISYPDIQKSFPEVDWATLDRLYVPAGSYETFQIGNLPARSADRPLVITNGGGQVKVGPNLGGNFIWSMGGGSNWVLTGRYDPESGTGDEAFPGHRCGSYAESRGKYGFLSDDAFDHSGAYSHMGLAVGGGATDFEIEFIEVTRSGFAGIRLLNSLPDGKADPSKPMANVRVHDTYVHDVDSEGFYFGWTGDPPSNLFPNLQVYNNRILRTGSETLQVQDLGEGTRVHHNVFAFGALRWLDNFGKYQDGCLQVLVREGAIEFDHNVTLGGAGTFLSFFSSPEAGDGPREVTFHDNYFADTRSLGGYLNGSSTAPSRFTFRDNFFRGFDFSYQALDPAAKDPGVAFGINAAHQAPILFEGNTLEGAALVSGIDLNGTRNNIQAQGNVSAAVAPVAFVASGYPGVPTAKLSSWARIATLAPGQPAITYGAGDLVMHDARLYRARAANTDKVPPDNLDVWEELPLPADDVRVAPGSPYAEMGIR